MQATFDPNDIYSALMTLNLKVGTIEQSVSSLEKTQNKMEQTQNKMNDLLEPIIIERKIAMEAKQKWHHRWQNMLIGLTIVGALIGALKVGDDMYLAHKAQAKTHMGQTK